MKYTEYYREDIDIAFEIPIFDLSGYGSVEEFEEQEEEIFCEALFSGLYNAIQMDLDWIPVFLIDNSDLVLTMEEQYYEEKIDRCLEYFISVENYEYCNILKILKDKILKD
jgi:hypothetical protein